MVRAVVAVSVLFLAVICPGTEADELAFGVVGADGASNVHFLEDPIPGVKGPAEFFDENAMSFHDWAHVRIVNRSFGAVSSLAARSSGEARTRINELEEALGPLFAALPKESSGLLSNASARYAVHRHFTQTKGWFFKGLQPAGAAWMASMEVTPAVKDVSKYIVPTYIQELLARQSSSEGTSLRGVAVIAATLEHLVHSEMLEALFHIYKALGFDPKGTRNAQEVSDILDTFMMVYAFGGILDYSTRKEVLQARGRIAAGAHAARWEDMRELSKVVWQRHETSTRKSQPTFRQLLEVVEEIGRQYSMWHSRSCSAAKERLLAFDTGGRGTVHFGAFHEARQTEPSATRVLFNETADELKSYGASVEEDGRFQVVVSNYFNSPAMCLSTASYYQACCPNACERLLSELEVAAEAPHASADVISVVVQRRTTVTSQAMSQLQGLAGGPQGHIALHSRAMAFWLHSVLPQDCPVPHQAGDTSPMTADAWLGKPPTDVETMEQMIFEADKVTKRFAQIDPKMRQTSAVHGEFPSLPNEEALVKFYGKHRSETPGAAGVVWSPLILGFLLMVFCAVVAVAARSLRAAPAEYKLRDHGLDSV